MEYVKVGDTDIRVSKLCVGCMSFGKAGTMHDWTLDEKQSEKLVNKALELGINFLIQRTAILWELVKSILTCDSKVRKKRGSCTCIEGLF